MTVKASTASIVAVITVLFLVAFYQLQFNKWQEFFDNPFGPLIPASFFGMLGFEILGNREKVIFDKVMMCVSFIVVTLAMIQSVSFYLKI